MVRTAIAEKADIIFAGAGLPFELPSFLKPDSETKIVPIVSSGRAAKIICEKCHEELFHIYVHTLNGDTCITYICANCKHEDEYYFYFNDDN
jgi:hypothetical protein